MERNVAKPRLTQKHFLWDQFYERLWRDKCRLRWLTTRKRRVIWNCSGDFAFATVILRDMEADVEATLKHFRRRRVHCDCEVMFHLVPESWGEPRNTDAPCPAVTGRLVAMKVKL